MNEIATCLYCNFTLSPPVNMLDISPSKTYLPTNIAKAYHQVNLASRQQAAGMNRACSRDNKREMYSSLKIKMS